MKTSFVASIAALLLAGAVHAQTFTGKPQYEILVKRGNVSMGKINVEMFPAIAPNHVRNWDSLVAIKFYDSIAFHRVIPGFMIQGGDPNTIHGPQSTWGFGGSGVTLQSEFSAVSHRRGILSAARTDDPNSATSQFFICIGSPTYLDKQYTVYGKVTSGMNVADSVVNSERDAADRPLEKITMFIIRTGSNDSVTAMPQLLVPANESTLPVTPKVLFRWKKISDAMLYTIQIATEADFSNLVLNNDLRQIDTSVSVGGMTEGITYYWRIRANNGGNPSEFSETRTFVMLGSGVEEIAVPELLLYDVHPNPITDKATIGYSLREGAHITLSVVDLFGNTLHTLVRSEYRAAGEHEVQFDAHLLSAGVYVIRLEGAGAAVTRRIVVE